MQKTDKYTEVKAEISSICHENKDRYDYRRITMELPQPWLFLKSQDSIAAYERTELGLPVGIKKYRSYKGDVGKIAPNLLNRDFHAERPEVGYRC